MSAVERRSPQHVCAGNAWRVMRLTQKQLRKRAKRAAREEPRAYLVGTDLQACVAQIVRAPITAPRLDEVAFVFSADTMIENPETLVDALRFYCAHEWKHRKNSPASYTQDCIDVCKRLLFEGRVVQPRLLFRERPGIHTHRPRVTHTTQAIAGTMLWVPEADFDQCLEATPAERLIIQVALTSVGTHQPWVWHRREGSGTEYDP